MKKTTHRPWLRQRQWVFISITGLALQILIFRFFTLQVTQHTTWLDKANRQHLSEHRLPSKRGRFICAANLYAHHPLTTYEYAKDAPVYHLFTDTSSIPPYLKPYIAEKIAQILNLDENSSHKLEMELSKISRSRKLLSGLSRNQKDDLESWWKAFQRAHKIPKNALFYIRDFARVYPQADSAGYLLQAISQYKDPLQHFISPIGGLELLFNQKLTGRSGYIRLCRTLKNPLLLQDQWEASQDGQDIILSLHPQLQAYCEKILQWGVGRHNAKAGWAIVLNIEDGQVLTLAQYPRFDPRNFRDFFNDPNKLWQTRVWSIQDAHEPGSIFKPIILAIALKANDLLCKSGQTPLFAPEEMIDLRKIQLRGRKRPLKDTSFAHWLNMDLALKKSSNIYMAKLAQDICDRLGSQWLADEIRKFGFGSPTGIEFPSESAGLVPQPGKKYLSGAFQWSAPTPHSLSMGHNILATSLQVARAYCTLANGGYRVYPSLILKNREQNREKIIDEHLTKRVLESMAYVTKIGGSGVRANVWGYSDGGKSGTANKIHRGTYDSKYSLSSFIGIVPIEKPKFVILVCYDEPEHFYIPGEGFNHRGSFCAAPSFKFIANEALRTFNIAPDDPNGYAPGDPKYDDQQAHWQTQAQTLNELFKQYHP